MSSRAEASPPVVVVAAIAVSDPEAVPKTLAAVRAQVYEAARVVLIGGDSDVRRAADAEGSGWYGSLGALLTSLAPSVSHVWVLRSGAVPLPDALGALVFEAERNGAAIAGSKLVQAAEPERLISVGMATDVFDAPYLGLDSDEIDFGQYDVVRDVAAVSSASVLMRKDLARGVDGPDPKMAPIPGAVDFCQRARLRGARVIVVPSSEVLIDPERTRDAPWREEAGRIRAMLKAYSVLTLVWALPISFLIGLIEAIAAPFLGRWSLFSWLAAWMWNLVMLPSTIAARRRARRGRVGDDAELFRYQVRGSAQLRTLGGEIASRLRDRLGFEEGRGLIDIGQDLRQPAFVVGVLAVLFTLFSTRTVWSGGMPAAGYSLPLPASGPDAVSAYAGGWNPAGMGSIEPLRPFIAFAGLVQTLLLDRPGATMAFLVVAAAMSALWGTVRMLRSFGIETVPALFGSAVLIAGPAAQAIMADTGVTTWLALGVVPWAIRVPLARWPDHTLGRVGRVAATAWVTGIVAMLSPLVGLIPVVALAGWAIVNVADRHAWLAAAVALVGSAVAVPLLFPWLLAADLERFVEAGAPAFWSPAILLMGAFAVAVIGVAIAAPGGLASVGIWGGALSALGAIAARSGDLRFGREVEQAGLALVSLGVAAVVAAGFEAIRRVDVVVGWRRFVVGVAAVAGMTIAASTLLVVFPGRIGLPGDQLDRRIGFTAAATGEPESARILVIGPADSLPGDSREVRGAHYRVVSAPSPTIDEAWLSPPTAADDALALALDQIIDGDTSRAGEVLAGFGIRWVISLGDTPFESVFSGQLDLVALGTAEGLALTFEGAAPVRAVADDGTPWIRTTWGYRGPASDGRVVVAESPNGRWTPEWSQVSWANEVSAATGEIRFNPIQGRRTQALFAAGLGVVLMVVSVIGRRKR